MKEFDRKTVSVVKAALTKSAPFRAANLVSSTRLPAHDISKTLREVGWPRVKRDSYLYMPIVVTWGTGAEHIPKWYLHPACAVGSLEPWVRRDRSVTLHIDAGWGRVLLGQGDYVENVAEVHMEHIWRATDVGKVIRQIERDEPTRPKVRVFATR